MDKIAIRNGRAARVQFTVALGVALLLAVACGLPLPSATPSSTPLLPSPTWTATATPLPTATPTPSPTPSPTPTPADLYLAPEDVTIYPVPQLYSGDVVTFDVTPRNLGQINPYSVVVRVDHQAAGGATSIVSGRVGYPTFDSVPRARMIWAWDTTGLAGEQLLTITLDPDDQIQDGDEEQENNVVELTLQLLPAAERPAVEAASWATATSDCCVYHYITGTAAERDLAAIIEQAEAGVAYAQSRLGAVMEEPFDIYLLDRVIGHGGYARDGLALSYLDRNYAGQDLLTVTRHEATHVLDFEMLTQWSPALVREGLATWVAGGHFKPEPIPERAAALLEFDGYIPLDALADDFYRQQHEIGYLQGAAFVNYLVETYGWEGFLRFYQSFDSSYDTPTEILDASLRENLSVDFAQAQTGFLAWLEAHPPSPEQVRDLEDTIDLFDTIRRYQSLYDPSAYFLVGWLPDPAEGGQRGIVADFMRRPRAPDNIALETMLIAAQEALLAGSFERTEELLDAVNQVLSGGGFAHAPAADYLAIVQTAAAAGYEVQRIRLEGNTAHVTAVAAWPVLVELSLQRQGSEWSIE
ncbi:MAG: hypothetical protein JW900_06865 [Anaerolineae bacterium]|nr:hypothetical protein [Anaerolineae bacterium]